MSDFEEFKRVGEKIVQLKLIGAHYRAMALESLRHGNYDVARFQIGQEMEMFFTFSTLMDSKETGCRRTREEMEEEFVNFALAPNGPYRPFRDILCRVMGWCPDDAARDEKKIKNLVESCGVKWIETDETRKENTDGTSESTGTGSGETGS